MKRWVRKATRAPVSEVVAVHCLNPQLWTGLHLEHSEKGFKTLPTQTMANIFKRGVGTLAIRYQLWPLWRRSVSRRWTGILPPPSNCRVHYSSLVFSLPTKVTRQSDRIYWWLVSRMGTDVMRLSRTQFDSTMTLVHEIGLKDESVRIIPTIPSVV